MSSSEAMDARLYSGVMVSSTFSDLVQHRAELLRALRKEKLFAIGMEEYVVSPDDDVISSSLNMVAEAAAYIGLISHRCGQVIECPERNPNGFSVSRLEFEEAQRRQLPTLIFVMGDDHPVKKGEVEVDPDKIAKLDAYRKRAKDGRIYVEFNDLQDFTKQAIHAVASLRRYLDESRASHPKATPDAPPPQDVNDDVIPTAPRFYAEPAYLGSHEFVGRKAQLDTLDDWASAADAHPVLLFEAIGGTGKSMLSWHWTTTHAVNVRDDWAGRFWYSFYEKGADMADFCQRALAYMTGKPRDSFRKRKAAELADPLLDQLRARPWLLILDGLERVLVAYQRFNAAQLPDEDAGSDNIARRDPCSAIRPEDDDLLRSLGAAAPSKLLLTTRLTPRALLNTASQPIPGVLRERLPGLRPADAEELLRACGIRGTSAVIQEYLKTHCDCHPLVTGVLAGLINDYMPDRGNFDAWAADANHGGRLNLANLDLVQKRNHILRAALAALPEEGRQLLSTLALLSEAVDYPTLIALNPLRPEPPAVSEQPGNPATLSGWNTMSEAERETYRRFYEMKLARWQEYERALSDYRSSKAVRDADDQLASTVRDLERRGLLQYDPNSRRHDLHPVVRGVAAGSLKKEEKLTYGRRVVDHFAQQAHSPYDQAESVDDVRFGLNVVRTLLLMGQPREAFAAYRAELDNALAFNLEAYSVMLTLLKPLFPEGFTALPRGLDKDQDKSVVMNDVAIALLRTGEFAQALDLFGLAIQLELRRSEWLDMPVAIRNAALALEGMNRLADEARCLELALTFAPQLNAEDLFRVRLDRFRQLSITGQWDEAERMWQLLDPMGRGWSRVIYRAGEAELNYAQYRFWRGDLTPGVLEEAERTSKAGRKRLITRTLHLLRGEWHLASGEYDQAANSLHEAVRMARELGTVDSVADCALALARLRLGRLGNAAEEAAHLAAARDPAHRFLAELWLGIGDEERAASHALAAYRWAWADGEPYTRRYELERALDLLERLGIAPPLLPAYSRERESVLPWEDLLKQGMERANDNA